MVVVKVFSMDDLGYNTITFDGTKAKIVCATMESLPPKIFIGAKEVKVLSNYEEVCISIVYSSQEDVAWAEKAAKDWCSWFKKTGGSLE